MLRHCISEGLFGGEGVAIDDSVMTAEGRCEARPRRAGYRLEEGRDGDQAGAACAFVDFVQAQRES